MLFLLLEQIPLAWDALKADLISAGTAGKPPLAEGTPVLPPCCSGAGMLSVVGTFSLVKRQGKELEIMTSPTTPALRAVFIHQDLFVCSSSGGARLLFAGSRQERIFGSRQQQLPRTAGSWDLGQKNTARAPSAHTG